MNKLGLTENDKIAMHEAGFSWKALEMLTSHDFQKWIDDVSISHTKESPKKEAVKLCIKVVNEEIIDSSCTYVGCPALAAIVAATTQLIRNKPIDYARNLNIDIIWDAIESLPPNHEEHIEFVLDALKETLTLYANQKTLTKAEHENYVHLCGLTGREIEECDIDPCDTCPMVQNCENDHVLSK